MNLSPAQKQNRFQQKVANYICFFAWDNFAVHYWKHTSKFTSPEICVTGDWGKSDTRFKLFLIIFRAIGKTNKRVHRELFVISNLIFWQLSELVNISGTVLRSFPDKVAQIKLGQGSAVSFESEKFLNDEGFCFVSGMSWLWKTVSSWVSCSDNQIRFFRLVFKVTKTNREKRPFFF